MARNAVERIYRMHDTWNAGGVDRVAELWQHLDAERARAELGIGPASSRPWGRAT